ncbi:conjugal transfer protein TrbG [Fulvimarina endophytica]|uniref:Conjugal transfer protein TrbG n=1 Tax=Fulvimarina endophytica TaxID=2293836 RepID=A0A371WY28_9HYPH|nr:TrbG/VirB9 family P-type conjugative transfer protein [Fulvimarina endophytica]RFC61878.1 conjugal transfer protein TrbG [Fulvimarina endophytica]
MSRSLSFRLVGPLVLTAVTVAAAQPALSESRPASGRYDERVREATYRDGEVYRINVAMTHVTSVEFGQGETIRSIIAGDTEGFQLDGVPGGRAFAIKPAARGVSTNITVYTNRRSYYFNVREAAHPHYVIRFAYPNANDKPQNAVARRAPNYSYGASGSSEITPNAVWDNGTFTYFQFPKSRPIPAIFRVSGNGERSVNTLATEQDVVRVSGVSGQWVLRLGDQVICIQALPQALVTGAVG